MTKSRPGPTRIIPGKQDRRGADDTGARPRSRSGIQCQPLDCFVFLSVLAPNMVSLSPWSFIVPVVVVGRLALFVNTRWYCDPGAPPLDLMAPGAQCHSSDAETIHCLRSSLEMMGLSHSKQQQGMAGSMRQGQHHSPRYDSVMSLEFLLCHTCRSALVLEVPIFVPPSLRTPYCLSIVGKMCVNYDSYLFRG